MLHQRLITEFCESKRGQIIDIENDAATVPTDWNTLVKPALDTPEDITTYELHVRDFSAYDETVAANIETLALLGRTVTPDLWDRSILEEVHG